MNLPPVGDADLSPLGVIERAALKERVFDAGRLELADARLVWTSAARAVTWVVFTRHRITCVGGIDPTLCGCVSDLDQFHAYQAEPGTPGAVPLRPDLPADSAGPPRCKDCPPDSKRPAPYRGPRCRAHHRQVKARRSAGQHARSVKKYGISIDEYWELYRAQGGRCALCRISNGSTKRLAVDHDHDTGEVRGLLCAPCNKILGRRFRNSPEAFARGLLYLIDPPARSVLPPHPEVDGPPLSDEERARAAAAVAEQVARARTTEAIPATAEEPA